MHSKKYTNNKIDQLPEYGEQIQREKLCKIEDYEKIGEIVNVLAQ